MLKVKNLTLLGKIKMKKGGKFYHGCKTKSSFARFCLQPGVAFWLDFNQNFVLYRMKVISGLYYQSSYGHFLPTTFEKVNFYWIFFVKVTPRKNQNVRMRNFCNGF